MIFIRELLQFKSLSLLCRTRQHDLIIFSYVSLFTSKGMLTAIYIGVEILFGNDQSYRSAHAHSGCLPRTMYRRLLKVAEDKVSTASLVTCTGTCIVNKHFRMFRRSLLCSQFCPVTLVQLPLGTVETAWLCLLYIPSGIYRY